MTSKGNAIKTYSYDDVDKIDKVKAELESYENDLAKLKNGACVSCRAVIGLDMTFCPAAAKAAEPEKRMSAATATTTTLAVACDDNDACCDEAPMNMLL